MATLMLTGLDLKLYLDADGWLVITDRPRLPSPGLRELTATRDLAIAAPLDGVVTATVEILVSELDLSIPLETVRLLVADTEVAGDCLPEIKRLIEARRQAVQAAAAAGMLSREGEASQP